MTTAHPSSASNEGHQTGMRYKEVEYTLVQTSSPSGWKWSFKDAVGREKSGASADRRFAISTAEHAIEKLLLKNRKTSANE
jgi:hypothetical protein